MTGERLVPGKLCGALDRRLLADFSALETAALAPLQTATFLDSGHSRQLFDDLFRADEQQLRCCT
jgi:hypothetical protein